MDREAEPGVRVPDRLRAGVDRGRAGEGGPDRGDWEARAGEGREPGFELREGVAPRERREGGGVRRRDEAAGQDFHVHVV